MVKREMHPTVKQFKQLMDDHPELKDEMLRRQFTLQQFFEEWYVLGEKSFLDKYLVEEKEEVEDLSESEKVADQTEKDNSTDVSLFIDNAVSAVSTISGLLSMFRPNKASPKSSTTRDMKSLFQFRED